MLGSNFPGSNVRDPPRCRPCQADGVGVDRAPQLVRLSKFGPARAVRRACRPSPRSRRSRWPWSRSRSLAFLPKVTPRRWRNVMSTLPVRQTILSAVTHDRLLVGNVAVGGVTASHRLLLGARQIRRQWARSRPRAPVPWGTRPLRAPRRPTHRQSSDNEGAGKDRSADFILVSMDLAHFRVVECGFQSNMQPDSEGKFAAHARRLRGAAALPRLSSRCAARPCPAPARPSTLQWGCFSTFLLGRPVTPASSSET